MIAGIIRLDESSNLSIRSYLSVNERISSNFLTSSIQEYLILFPSLYKARLYSLKSVNLGSIKSLGPNFNPS